MTDNLPPLLPSDARLLNRMVSSPVWVGSRHITARQIRTFMEHGWMTTAHRPFSGASVNCYILTESGLARIRAYNERTIDRTF